MSSRRSRAVALALVVGSLAIAVRAAAAPPPACDFGSPATPAQIAGWRLDVEPDGSGLPPGSGTAAGGAAIFAQRCASCHGAQLEGMRVPGRGSFPRLVGGRGTLATTKPIVTVGSYWPYATGIFDYIRRAMPLYAPGSLSADQVYALTAYILERNAIIAPSQTIDATTLPKVTMPNAGGFYPSEQSIEATRARR